MIAIGLFLVTRGAFTPAAILMGIGVLKLGLHWQDPSRRFFEAIQRDASRFNLRLPRDPFVMSGLENVYAKYWQASDAYPSLASQYDELIQSMWMELASTQNGNDWRRIIRRVADGWTTPWSTGERPVEASLDRLKQASSQWQEAQREAFGARGPSRV